MLGLIIFGSIIWIIVQASAEKHQRKWKGRFSAPLALRLRGDMSHIGRQIRARLVFRRAHKRGDEWDIREVL